MTGQKALLSNYTEKFSRNLRFGNHQFSPILGYGDIIQDNITIKNVSYVEHLGYILFSIDQFCDKGLKVNFKSKSCSVRTEDGKELLVGNQKTNLYTNNLSKVQNDNQVCLLTKASMQRSWLWHQRLSHLNFRYINKLVSGKLVNGPLELKYVKEHLRAACEKWKMKRDPHKPKPEPSTSSPLELLHMDLYGPMRTQSIGGKKYVLVIVDNYSRYRWVKFLRSKDETPEVLITFSEDDPGESAETSQVSSEPVVTGVLAYEQLSSEPVLEKNKSNEASCSTSHLSDLDILFELFDDEYLGSNVYKPVVVDRMEDSTTNHLTTSDVSPESNSLIQQDIPIQMPTPIVEVVSTNDEQEVAESVGCAVRTIHQTEQVVPTKASAPITLTESLPHDVQNEEVDSGFLDDNHDQSSSNPLPHKHLWTKEHPLHQVIDDLNKSVKTRSTTLNQCMHDSILSKIETTRVLEALADSNWVSAVQEELNQFEALKVWILVPKPEGKTVIGTKWVFKNKKDENGIVIRNKARLVTKGYRKEEGIDYACSSSAYRGNLHVSSLRNSQEFHCLSNGREDCFSKWHT
ncbi:hypothetical protein L6452_18402 [Arctium lappa]|uniref:Uncharacterized protein n=1 Tax=Arctium lappa TaxID=4217 RepID=A0ACB9C5Y1_ARCLA|nr:hypothetical protein L6452_18402 [Arctium lappa]